MYWEELCLIVILLLVLGKTENTRRRRVVGPTVQPNQAHLFRYQAAFQENCGQSCGGTIISNRIIVTAAHCISKGDPRKMTVKVGITNLKDSGQIVDVFAYRVHPDFRGPPKTRNDIAILILQNKLDLTSLTVADLADHNQDFTGKRVNATGWGSTEKLTYTTFEVKHNPGCRHESHLCAEEVIPNTNIYTGDSGGPLVLREENRVTLVGVISFKVNNIHDVFTNISSLRPWLDVAIKEANFIANVIDRNDHSLKTHKCN